MTLQTIVSLAANSCIQGLTILGQPVELSQNSLGMDALIVENETAVMCTPGLPYAVCWQWSLEKIAFLVEERACATIQIAASNAMEMTGTESPSDAIAVLREVFEHRPRVILLDRNCVLSDGSGEIQVLNWRIDGKQDLPDVQGAFAAGYMASILQGQTFNVALEHGALNAMSVADTGSAGLLNWNQLEEAVLPSSVAFEEQTKRPVCAGVVAIAAVFCSVVFVTWAVSFFAL